MVFVLEMEMIDAAESERRIFHRIDLFFFFLNNSLFRFPAAECTMTYCDDFASMKRYVQFCTYVEQNVRACVYIC